MSAAALCIDFGTSSIRAVYRPKNKSRLEVLPLGQIVKSRLDDASIPSHILVNETGSVVRFGEQAEKERISGTPFLFYDASPKLWLSDYLKLSEPVAEGTTLTRQEALAGLLAHALRCAFDASRLSVGERRAIPIQVAHPVWSADIRTGAREGLRQIVSVARQIALKSEWGRASIDKLRRSISETVESSDEEIDTVEPIAAAVELFPEDPNEIRLVAVIDMGAGTTDIALFQSITPDVATPNRPQMRLLGNAISLFKAGDFIDSIVLEVLKSRASSFSEISIADVEFRIRDIKQTLFSTGTVRELKTSVTLKEITNHPKFLSLMQEVRDELTKLLAASEGIVDKLVNRQTHSVKLLDIVLAGGGSSIQKLKQTLIVGVHLGNQRIPIRIIPVAERPNVSTFGAGRGRLAVALGAAAPGYEHLITAVPVPVLRSVG